MRQLSFVENNRPGDSRLPANRRAVRSWAARDPLGKAGQRLKRRRRRYKTPSIVYIDDRAIEALQSTNPIPLAHQQQEHEEEDDDETSSATSQPSSSSVFTPINHASHHHPQSCPNDTQSQTPPNLAAGPAPSHTPRNESALTPRSTPPQRPASSTRSLSPTPRPLNPIFVDPAKNHPRVARQPPPISIPDHPQSDRKLDPPELAPSYVLQWDDLTLKHRTQSLGPHLPPHPPHAQAATDPRQSHASRSPPSAVSELAHRVITNHRTGLPPIVTSDLTASEAEESPLVVSLSSSPAISGIKTESGSPRTNSFKAFAIRHSNFSWSHINDSAPLVSSDLRMPVRLAPSILTRNVTSLCTFDMASTANSAATELSHGWTMQTHLVHPAIAGMHHRTGSVPPMGHLSRLPAELRALVYSNLLISERAKPQTYGRSSGISISILSTNRAIYNEAVDLLYTSPHHLAVHAVKAPPARGQGARTVHPLPPYHAIARMQNMTLAIAYSTTNRGECETSMKELDSVLALSDPLALVLIRSTCLKSLALLLLNDSVRKMGINHFRSKEMMGQMKRILFPFAHFQRRVDIEITGFRTLDFAEMFAEMREMLAGREAPIEELLEDAMGMRKAGSTAP